MGGRWINSRFLRVGIRERVYEREEWRCRKRLKNEE
jgi:hypothetical protein